MPFENRLIENLDMRLLARVWVPEQSTVPGCRAAWWQMMMFSARQVLAVVEVPSWCTQRAGVRALIEDTRFRLFQHYWGFSWPWSLASHILLVGGPEIVEITQTHIVNDVTSFHRNIVGSVWAVDRAGGGFAESRFRFNRSYENSLALLVAEACRDTSLSLASGGASQ